MRCERHCSCKTSSWALRWLTTFSYYKVRARWVWFPRTSVSVCADVVRRLGQMIWWSKIYAVKLATLCSQMDAKIQYTVAGRMHYRKHGGERQFVVLGNSRSSFLRTALVRWSSPWSRSVTPALDKGWTVCVSHYPVLALNRLTYAEHFVVRLENLRVEAGASKIASNDVSAS